MKSGKRYHLRAKKIKELLTIISQDMKILVSSIYDKQTRVEVVELVSGNQILLFNSTPAFINIDERIYPSLLNERVLPTLPTITVDSGAVPYICNGANLMAPGIVAVNNTFDQGDIVTIIEERHSKQIAIAETLFSSIEISNKPSGKVANTIHYIGDSYWMIFKEL